MKSKIILFGCLLFFVNGCATVANLDELLTLKNLDNDQKKMQSCLQLQENAFRRLLGDVKANKVKMGVSRNHIIAKYGEPILSDCIKDGSGNEALLYRHPTGYFDSEKIYLYFDKSKRLARIECKFFKKE